MKLKATILPAKVLADGTHKIRIAMSHNGATRYFMTRFVVEKESNLTNGTVTGVSNAAYINQQLLKQMTEIYKAYDELEDTDYLTCSQLLEAIEEKIKGQRPITLYEAIDLFRNHKLKTASPASIRIIDTAVAAIKLFFDKDYFLKNLNAMTVYNFRDFLALERNHNQTTQGMYINYFRYIVSFAIRQKRVEFAVHPFRDVEVPKAIVRDVSLSMEQLRRIINYEFSGPLASRLDFCRNLFLLSFYLCGMNIVDILNVDLTKDKVHYIRQKMKSRKPEDKATEFTIQPEAAELISKIIVNGKVSFNGKALNYNSASRMMNRYLKRIAEMCDIDRRVIFYSARKTFAQIANELMIKDSIIEFCIGDTVSTEKKTIGSYTYINRRMADIAIRKIFDAVASGKSMEQLQEEALGLVYMMEMKQTPTQENKEED